METPDYNPAVGPFDANGNYVEAWADNPPKLRSARNRGTNTTTNFKPKPGPRSEITSLQAKAQPKPRTETKPEPVRAKPKIVLHVVKRGDTLYGLARKYGSSVSKIQKTNGLRGTLIVDGKTLFIPR